MHQGKRRDQIEFSYKVCAIGVVGIIAIAIVLGLWRWMDTPSAHAEPTKLWIPTEEDILTIDSLYKIVKDTEEDVVELNQSVDRIDTKLDDLIERRLDYDDGSYDSIRYNANDIDIDTTSCMHSIYGDEYQMWITGEGDTIYE